MHTGMSVYNTHWANNIIEFILHRIYLNIDLGRIFMSDKISYGNFASIYDMLTDDVEYSKRCDYLEKIFEKHLNKKPSLVADLGCGTGTVCSLMAKR